MTKILKYTLPLGLILALSCTQGRETTVPDHKGFQIKAENLGLVKGVKTRVLNFKRKCAERGDPDQVCMSFDGLEQKCTHKSEEGLKACESLTKALDADLVARVPEDRLKETVTNLWTIWKPSCKKAEAKAKPLCLDLFKLIKSCEGDDLSSCKKALNLYAKVKEALK